MVLEFLSINLPVHSFKFSNFNCSTNLNENETNMLRDNVNIDENNFQQHVSSIRQLKNKLF
jgi:hypothetical protein